MIDQLKRDRLRISVNETYTRTSFIEIFDSPDTSDSAQLVSPASTFRTPNFTESDEEEIEVLERQTKQVDIASRSSRSTFGDSQHSPGVLPRFDESEHLSQLGDSTHLFSPKNSLENSPEPFSQFKETCIEPRQSSLTSNNLFRNSRSHQNILKGRQKRGKMVVEREPPKAAKFSPQKQNESTVNRYNMEKVKPPGSSDQTQNRPSLDNIQRPEFGMVSPLQNRLQSSAFNIPKRQQNGNELQSSVFNIPKSQQPRVEHHRPGNNQAQIFRNPYQSNQSAQPKNDMKLTNNADFFEIPRPANHPTWSIQHPVQPTFSSFVPATVDTSSRIGNFVDLTSTVNQFNPGRAIYDDFFGAEDSYEYVDIAKATENIKALLEGAFDDDEGKPRTRARKKKVEAAIPALVEKLQSTVLENEQNKEVHHEREVEGEGEEGEEEDDDDDGTIEGLQIKLLPHQVEGVEWMRDKEVGTKKKNGVLPKGGILADDVRWPVSVRGVADCTIDGSRENYTVYFINTYKSSTTSFSKWSR